MFSKILHLEEVRQLKSYLKITLIKATAEHLITTFHIQQNFYCERVETGKTLTSAGSAERVIGRLHESRARFKFELDSETLWNLERRDGGRERIFIRKLKCQKSFRVQAHHSYSSRSKFCGPRRSGINRVHAEMAQGALKEMTAAGAGRSISFQTI